MNKLALISGIVFFTLILLELVGIINVSLVVLTAPIWICLIAAILSSAFYWFTNDPADVFIKERKSRPTLISREEIDKEIDKFLDEK